MKTANNEGKYCLIGIIFCDKHVLEINPGIGLIFKCKKYNLDYHFDSFCPFNETERQRAMQELSEIKCLKE